MDIIFKKELAKCVGVSGAIVVEWLKEEVRKSQLNNSYFFVGRHWVYTSVDKMKKHFGFWSTAQMRGILEKLVKKNYIDSGNFNSIKIDMTKCYTLCESLYELEIGPIKKEPVFQKQQTGELDSVDFPNYEDIKRKHYVTILKGYGHSEDEIVVAELFLKETMPHIENTLQYLSMDKMRVKQTLLSKQIRDELKEVA